MTVVQSSPGLIFTAILIGKHSNTNLIIKYLWLLFVHALSLRVFDVGVTVYPGLLSHHIHCTFCAAWWCSETNHSKTTPRVVQVIRVSPAGLDVFFFCSIQFLKSILDNKDTVNSN